MLDSFMGIIPDTKIVLNMHKSQLADVLKASIELNQDYFKAARETI